tara:strand:- start:5728 stop:6483 length:756 start_codon:yes stop_codon:yes gene_type:complete
MKKILVIGDSCHDIYHYGHCERLSPEAPVPIFKEIEKVTKPGMSLNVSKNLEALGFEVIHFTNEEEITKHRFVDVRFKQHLLRVDRGEEKLVKKVNIEKVLSVKDIDGVVISDYNKGFLRIEDCIDICKSYQELNIPVFVDSKKRKLDCFSNCWLKINESEYNAAESFPDNVNILITLGQRGAMYEGKVYPAERVEVFDVCGAGDVFLSSFIKSYLDTENIQESISFANKLASLSVSKFGTYVLKPEDLKV